MLLEFLIVVVEITELIWQNIGIWRKVKCILSEPLLKAHDIEAQTVLPGDLVALREVIDLLILVKALILVALARTGAPEEIPLMGVRRRETMLLKHRPAQFIVESDHFEQQL